MLSHATVATSVLIGIAGVGIVVMSARQRDDRLLVPQVELADSSDLLEVGVAPRTVHDSNLTANPFAALFVLGARWTLPCEDVRIAMFSGGPDEHHPTSPTVCRAVELRTVGRATLVQLRCGNRPWWLAMTPDGLYDLGRQEHGDDAPHATRNSEEPPAPGRFDARDLAILRRRHPLISTRPETTEWHEAGDRDYGTPGGRYVSSSPFGPGWCAETSIDHGGGPHYTYLCVGKSVGLVGFGSGQSQGDYVGSQCGEIPRNDALL